MLAKLVWLLLLVLVCVSLTAVAHSPLGGKGHHHLKLRKRISYSDSGVMALNGAGSQQLRKKTKMPPRKMIEKPRLRFKAGGKLAPKHNNAQP